MKKYEFCVETIGANGQISFDMSEIDATDLVHAFQQLIEARRTYLNSITDSQVSISVIRDATDLVIEKMKQPLEE